MSVIGSPSDKEISEAWLRSMEEVLHTNEIPEANKYQCGTYRMHSLDEAKEIAKEVIEKGIDTVKNKDIELNF
jgi:S-ribosylhomocysteine lyase